MKGTDRIKAAFGVAVFLAMIAFATIRCETNANNNGEETIGSCCSRNDECFFVSLGECQEKGGRFIGTDVACYPDPCSNEGDDDDASDDSSDDAGDDSSDDAGDDSSDDDTSLLFYDDFDSYAENQPPPSPWDVYTTGDTSIIIVNEKGGSGRWVQLFSTWNSGDSGSLLLNRDTPWYGIYSIEFDYGSLPESEMLFVFGYYDGEGCNGQHLWWRWEPPLGDSIWQDYNVCAQWETGIWHTIKIRTYEGEDGTMYHAVIIDGEETDCVGGWAPLHPECIQIYLWNRYTISVLDNVKIYNQ